MISEQRIEGYELQGTPSLITNNTNQNGSQDYNLKLN
jgi:hypothetical protein